MKSSLLAAFAVAGFLVAACGGAAAPVPPTTSATAAPTTPAIPAGGGQPESLVAKGHVADSAGHPLAGVVANADFQLSGDYSIDGQTDASGNYRIALDPPNSSWHMSALYTTTWNGVEYGFDMAPLDDSPFVGADGGVRDFVWRLSGLTPDGATHYGGTVYEYMDFSGDLPIDPQYVNLTLTPDGPLVDGSTGAVITGTGDQLDDVPVGRYIVTAGYQEPGKPSADLLVRVRDQGDFAPSVSAQFAQVSVTGQQLELEVRSR